MVKNLINRLFIAALFILGLFVLILKASSLVHLAILTIWVALTVNEFYDILIKGNIKVNKNLGIFISTALPVVLYFKIFSVKALIFAGVVYLIARNVFLENVKDSISKTAYTIFGVIYISLMMSHLIYINRLVGEGANFLGVPLTFGRVALSITFLLSSGADSMAYIVGRVFGRNKLAPKISPKKTVEGFIGAILWGMIVGIFMSYIGIFDFSVVALAIFGATASALSQIGDLGASMLKREYGVKDSGKLLASHGGLLDRCDSIIFTAPFVYYFLSI